MKGIKILQVNKHYHPWLGGIETVVKQLAENINIRSNYSVEVLCCQPYGKRSIDVVNTVKIWRASSLGRLRQMPISLDFFSLFRRLTSRVDLLAIHHPFPLVDLALFLIRPKAPIIVHYHSDIVRQRFLKRFVEPLALYTLRRAEKIIVSNPNLKESSPLLKRFKEKCVVIPFGVPKNGYEISEAEVNDIRSQYGDFMLCVGRLTYYKGIQYLVEAMKGIPEKLIIIGDGQEEKNFKEQVKNLNLEDRIIFLPKQPRRKLLAFFGACSCFILPSSERSEAFGIVLVEAMMCGKPVISTELRTGTSWVNQNQVTGFVVPPKDSIALADAIQKLSSHRDLREKLGQQANERALKFFTEEKMINSVLSLYTEVLNARK